MPTLTLDFDRSLDTYISRTDDGAVYVCIGELQDLGLIPAWVPQQITITVSTDSAPGSLPMDISPLLGAPVFAGIRRPCLDLVNIDGQRQALYPSAGRTLQAFAEEHGITDTLYISVSH